METDNQALIEHDTGCVSSRSSKHSSDVHTFDPCYLPLSVRDVITRLIEKFLGTWKRLPNEVRNAMIERPQDFQFIEQKIKPGLTEEPPYIEFNGTIWRYAGVWDLHDLPGKLGV